jgi:hypothetical protein
MLVLPIVLPVRHRSDAGQSLPLRAFSSREFDFVTRSGLAGCCVRSCRKIMSKAVVVRH